MAEQTENMNTLRRLDDALKSVEKEVVRCKVRLSHLELQDRTCEDTEKVGQMLQGVEHWIEGRIAVLLKDHPAYPWFSRVQGVGHENIPKCIAPLRIKPAQGYRKNKDTKALELVDLPYADTISAMWRFTGFGLNEDRKPDKRIPGETLHYNAELRTMWWRLASSLLRAGLRQKCSVCKALVGQNSIDKGEHRCKNAVFEPVAITRFAQYYLDQKARDIEQWTAKGGTIVPASTLPKNADGKRYEPEGVMSEGHVHNRALRKMIKLFQSCLFLVWREAEGLPATKPYPIDKLGHNSMIDPWKMVDR